MCGWLKDRFGLSWQIVPTRLYELISDPDPARAQAATEAMLGSARSWSPSWRLPPTRRPPDPAEVGRLNRPA